MSASTSSAASCAINLELPWNPAVLEQRIGRIYRLGQKLPIDVYYLVSEDGIEARIWNLVGTKRAFFSGLFDGSSNEVRFESSGSFLSRLEKLVEPAAVPEPAPDGAGAEEEGSPEALERVEREAEAAAAPDPSGPDRGEEAVSTAALAEPLPPPAELDRLFSRLEVRPTPRGGISIEAPPEAASTLAALFEGMGRLLRGAALTVPAAPPAPGAPPRRELAARR